MDEEPNFKWVITNVEGRRQELATKWLGKMYVDESLE